MNEANSPDFAIGATTQMLFDPMGHKAITIAVGPAGTSGWWTSYKDIAATLSPLISIIILAATLGTQAIYRKIDRERKAKSAILYVITRMQHWGETLAIAAIQWSETLDAKKVVRLNTSDLPSPPEFQHLRDLHELKIGTQEYLIEIEGKSKEIYEVIIQNGNRRATRNGNYAIVLATATAVTNSLYATLQFRDEYKLRDAPDSLISKLREIDFIIDNFDEYIKKAQIDLEAQPNVDGV